MAEDENDYKVGPGRPPLHTRFRKGQSENPGGCEDLLSLSPDDRAAASMFYIGYQASRLRARTINVGLIPSIEEQAISYCEENPDRTAAQAYANAYLRTRRR